MTVSFDREKFKKKFEEKHNKNSEEDFDDNSEVKDLKRIVKTYNTNKKADQKNDNRQQKQQNKNNNNRAPKKQIDDGTYKYKPFEAFFKSKKTDPDSENK